MRQTKYEPQTVLKQVPWNVWMTEQKPKTPFSIDGATKLCTPTLCSLQTEGAKSKVVPPMKQSCKFTLSKFSDIWWWALTVWRWRHGLYVKVLCVSICVCVGVWVVLSDNPAALWCHFLQVFFSHILIDWLLQIYITKEKGVSYHCYYCSHCHYLLSLLSFVTKKYILLKSNEKYEWDLIFSFYISLYFLILHHLVIIKSVLVNFHNIINLNKKKTKAWQAG